MQSDGAPGPSKSSLLAPRTRARALISHFQHFKLFCALLDPPRTRARASLGTFFLILSEFRVPRTRVLTSRKHVFRTIAVVFLWKSMFFIHSADKLVGKSSFSYVEYRVSAFPPKSKPRVLHGPKHFFPRKIAAKCRQTLVFHYGIVAVVRISGSPEAPPKAQKAHVDTMLNDI